jgi:hypothetical protein
VREAAAPPAFHNSLVPQSTHNTHGSVLSDQCPPCCAPHRPHLQNATLRDNILMGAPLEDQRYQAVLEACALRPDLDMLPAGALLPWRAEADRLLWLLGPPAGRLQSACRVHAVPVWLAVRSAGWLAVRVATPFAPSTANPAYSLACCPLSPPSVSIPTCFVCGVQATKQR